MPEKKRLSFTVHLSQEEPIPNIVVARALQYTVLEALETKWPRDKYDLVLKFGMAVVTPATMTRRFKSAR